MLISGSEAEKKFKRLRTVFARHNKMVRDSRPPSGSGADTKIYVPTWPLYKEMTFLTEVIKPRG